jgi:hypothetical protein
MNIPNKIIFKNSKVREDFLALRDLTSFFYESILDMEECYEEDFSPESRKLVLSVIDTMNNFNSYYQV